MKLIQKLDGHTDRVWTLAWNPLGTILASSGGDKNIRLWAKQSDKWACVSVLAETHSKSIRRICWSPCGQYLASASFDSTVCIWRRNQVDSSWATVVNLEGHENEVKSVAWSHDGHYLASCGRDRTVWIWERAENDTEDEEEDNAESWDCSDVKNDHTKDVKHIVWHPHHNILVSCSYDDTIKFFHKEGEDWTCYETLTSHTSTVWSADFSASGEFLVTCSDDRTVRVWRNHSHSKLPNVEPHSWKCVSVIQGYHNRTIYDVSWCKSNDVIVSASGDNSLVLYSRSQDDEDIFSCIDKVSSSHDCDVNSVTWNPKMPGLLASGGDDCAIKLWKFSHQDTEESEGKENPATINVSDFSDLLNLVQSFQNQQQKDDDEKQTLEELLDLKIQDQNPKPVELSNLCIDEKDGYTNDFLIELTGNQGNKYKSRIIIDKTKFKLRLPRRSVKFLTIANELFLIEKTGDMYKILPSGESQFLLGHLFMFTDLRLVTKNENRDISYVVSADRDEKIRISKYPDTFRIERYCFGHRHFIRRLVLVDDERFISIDQESNACLWKLTNMDLNSNPLKPERTVSLKESSAKRVCLRGTTLIKV